ncbi:tubulin nucleotide-binding domain-like protein [Acephala macrosclerotiorum]|nr:tubulin nucleotide-binding domain-like protein [Acephala macrosclerotiorum]
MHEIITLQLGQRSNYVATHFWNTQESYFTYSAEQESLVDHDIHFRPGIGADGSETFTPRTLIYDLKGGFGTLKKINALYEIDEPAVAHGLWNSPAVVQRQEVIQQNAYQQSLEEGLEPPPLTTESVRYWSDFNRVYFHPKSVVQLNEYELNSSLMPFENWSVGEELFNSLDKEHDLLDRDLRSFAEEADHMQGIQVISGIDDAWGGFAARYMDRIRDEYGKTTVCVWGVEDAIKSIPREKRFIRMSNAARSVSEIASQASLFIPMTVQSAMLPNHDVAFEVKGTRRKSGDDGSACQCAECEWKPEHRETPDEHRPERDSKRLEQSRGRRNTKKTHVFGQAECFRSSEGAPANEATEDEGFERARRRAAGLPIIQTQPDSCLLNDICRSRTPLPFPLLDSFPHIFARTSSGSSLGVKTSLSTDTTVASRIKELQHIVNRAIGVDEREALSNSLGEIAEAYEEGWDSGSDEDDD